LGEVTGDRVIPEIGFGSFAVAGAHEACEGLGGVEREGLFENYSSSSASLSHLYSSLFSAVSIIRDPSTSETCFNHANGEMA
jgi:hypothetical protein